jgi:hypothetical protein
MKSTEDAYQYGCNLLITMAKIKDIPSREEIIVIKSLFKSSIPIISGDTKDVFALPAASDSKRKKLQNDRARVMLFPLFNELETPNSRWKVAGAFVFNLTSIHGKCNAPINEGHINQTLITFNLLPTP